MVPFGSSFHLACDIREDIVIMAGNMKVNVLLSVLLMRLLYPAESIEVYEPEQDSEALALISTTELPLAQTDNGMALGDLSDQLTTGNVLHNLELHDELGAIENLTTPSFVSTDLPTNHKNYTGSPYVGAIELPPLLNQFNAYQQQYKLYQQQKNEFGYKPIKFEDNIGKNQYLSFGLGSYLEEDDARHKYEEMKHNSGAFPYAYENERLPLLGPSPWITHNELDGYNQYNHYEPKPEVNVATKDEEKGLYGWKKALKFFTALVPLGLLLATFTPSVISINSTVDQKPARQRSLSEKALNLTGENFKEFLMQKYGLKKTGDPQCESRVICELSRQGKEDTGSYVQRSFWYLANQTPEDIAEVLGVKDLFQAIRTGTCDVYKCQKKKKQAVRRTIKKRKTSEGVKVFI